MATTYAWGHWQEEWPEGRFRCIFVETNTESDGMLHATGLYRTTPGETFDDLETYQDRIDDRTIVVTDDNGSLLIKKEFAELLATLPNFLQMASRRLNRLESRAGRLCLKRTYEACL